MGAELWTYSDFSIVSAALFSIIVLVTMARFDHVNFESLILTHVTSNTVVMSLPAGAQ